MFHKNHNSCKLIFYVTNISMDLRLQIFDVCTLLMKFDIADNLEPTLSSIDLFIFGRNLLTCRNFSAWIAFKKRWIPQLMLFFHLFNSIFFYSTQQNFYEVLQKKKSFLYFIFNMWCWIDVWDVMRWKIRSNCESVCWNCGKINIENILNRLRKIFSHLYEKRIFIVVFNCFITFN